MAQIFISHASVDGAQAEDLQGWLHAQGFVSTFLDFDNSSGIAAGADWERTRYRELSCADAVILILTKNWFQSKWCFVEFAQARALGKAIFPLIETPEGETFVSSDIQHLNLVENRAGGLDRLRSELTRISMHTRGGYDWDSSRSPYPGLLAFEETDAAIYFGRDDDMRRLIERLNARRAQGGEKMLAVLGASGSGKSSLVRAGAIPRLKRDGDRWIVLPVFRPGRQPLDELAQCVSCALNNGAAWREWRSHLQADDIAAVMSDLARDLQAVAGRNNATVLLVIDQGEELFGGALAEQTEQMSAFWRALNAMTGAHLPFMIAMTLRSDYLGRLQEETRFEGAFEQFSLKPMPIERVREIIEGPARVAGLQVDDALVRAAIADAKTDDALPLLAFALRELYDRTVRSGRLSVEGYRAMGDAAAGLSPLENAVRRRADEVLALAKPSEDELEALKEAFIPAMVRVNAEGEYVRRVAEMASLPARALPLLEKLAQARLLTIMQVHGEASAEVAHEALLRKWPLLRGWLDEEREFLLGKDQLERDLLDWQDAVAREKGDALLTGLKLSRAKAWLAAKALQLSAEERAYIAASLARQDAEAVQRDRARKRTLRATVAAAVVLAMIAVAALLLWREADSRRLAAESLEDSGTDIGLAMREAVQAGQRGRTREAELALNTVLEVAPGQEFVLHHKGAVVGAVFSADGTRLATASMDGTARVWNAADGQLIGTLAGHDGLVNAVAFSPDGRKILTAGVDGAVRIWTADGQSLRTLSGHQGAVNTAVFSADGARILTAGDDRTARIWNAETGQLTTTLSGHTAEVNAAVFSADGRTVVTASQDRTARVWGIDGRSVVLAGHQQAVLAVAISSDGLHVVTGGADGAAKVWAVSGQGTPVGLEIRKDRADPVASVAYSPDGTVIATVSGRFGAQLWKAADGSAVATLDGHSDRVTSVAFSRDGARVITGSWDRSARIWDARTGDLLATLTGHTDKVNAASFGADGRTMVSASDDGTATMWHLENGHVADTWGVGRGEQVVGVDVAYRKGSISYVGAGNGQDATVYKDGKPGVALVGHAGRIVAAEFTRDGARIVTASQDHTAKVWNVADGRLIATMTGHGDTVNSVVFSADGKRVLTSSDDMTEKVWDAESGRLLKTLTGHSAEVNSAAFSSNDGGKRVVSVGGDGVALVQNAESGAKVDSMASGRGTLLYDAAFSPNGRYVVTAGSDHSARVWGAGGKLVTTLSGHTDTVYSVAFSRDGARIVTGGGDHTVRVWETNPGRLLATLHTGADPTGVRFSSDGKDILAQNDDGTLVVYRLDQFELMTWARKNMPVESGR